MINFFSVKNQKGSASLAFSFIIVIAFIGLVVYSFTRPEPESRFKVDDSKKESLELTKNNPMEENTNNTNTSNIKTTKNGDMLFMNYTGRLEDGTVFDSNIDPRFGHVEPFSFVLGAGRVIKGWDEGLVGMKVGDKKTLVIPPEKAYGNQQIGSIPPNSTLIFDVELVDIK